jgi:hypothetical protein
MLTRQRPSLPKREELRCGHQVNRQRDQFEASNRKETNNASRCLCAVGRAPNLGDRTRLYTTSSERGGTAQQNQRQIRTLPKLLQLYSISNISHRTLLVLIGRIICVRVHAVLGLEFVVAIVCPGKEPRQNRADKITNDEAATFIAQA